MKVARNTPEQLILDEKPWVAAVGISALFLVFTGIAVASVLEGEPSGLVALLGSGMAGIAFWAFVRRTQLILLRPDGEMILRRRWLNGYSEDRYRLEALQGAEVETTTGDKGRRLSRPVLVMQEGHEPQRVPLRKAYSSGGGSDHAAHVIERWLKAPDG